MEDGDKKKCTEDEDKPGTAAGNMGDTNKSVNGSNKTGDTATKIGDAINKTNSGTSKTGSTTDKTGDGITKTGDLTNKTNDATNKTGDTTNKPSNDAASAKTIPADTDKLDTSSHDTTKDISVDKKADKTSIGSKDHPDVSAPRSEAKAAGTITDAKATDVSGTKLTVITVNESKTPSVTDKPSAPQKAETKLTDNKDEVMDVKLTEKIDNNVKSSGKVDNNVKTENEVDKTVSGKKTEDARLEDAEDQGKNEPDDGKQRLIKNESKKKMDMAGDEEKAGDAVPARWIMAVLGCVGFMIVYGLKVNLSVAIIAMVNHTAVAGMSAHHDDLEVHGVHHEPEEVHTTISINGEPVNSSAPLLDSCGKAEKKEELQDGPFAWDENIQGLILASYFYGYLVTQVPGGWVAEKFSAKHVFGMGALVNAFCALLTPVAASGSYIWLVVMRIIMGIAGGVTLPAMHVLIAGWAPPQERSKISSTIYAGMTLGTLVCMPFSGLLAATLGWSSIFYMQGGLSILWYVLWCIFVYDSPAQHPRISKDERKFIEESLGTVVKTKKPPVPWKKVWTSLPVWAIIVAHTCNNWGWYMLLVKLPTYMRYILKFDIASNAGLSAVPFLCMWIFTMLLANILDALRSRKVITTTFARKLATFIASMPPAICLIGVTYVGCNTDLAVALLTLGTMFVGGMYSGFLSNHIDIAPPFAGTLMGITNTFATLPGIIVPSFVGYMTHGNQTVEAWRTIFFITLGIFSVEALFYSIFGSGEQQEWAKPKPSTQEVEQQKLNDVA
ncbi:putative inorganic phosphate cotransporter isoform X2 [Procambarus clarkii]|uniref:putative inorganic phosphate cotransporter isoform X2 n=1 Tax=Procambarus clarkii TaxID=6728 RepID=UPI003744AC1F